MERWEVMKNKVDLRGIYGGWRLDSRADSRAGLRDCI